jgi:hypothetical protein
MIEATASSLRFNEQQTSHLSALGGQAQMVKENDKALEERQVENTNDSAKPKMDLNTETRTDTLVVDDQVIIEKYNSDGKLVNVTPPGYVPLSTSI